MDVASATSDRAGSYRRLADGLRAFLPKPLPPDPPLDMDEPLQVLLSGADQSLGRLDGAVRILPDSDLFVFMLRPVPRASAPLIIAAASAASPTPAPAMPLEWSGCQGPDPSCN